MNNFIKIAKELQSTDDSEVVKVAGVLNKLKNLFKQITNRQYREAVQNMELEGGALSDSAKNLSKYLDALTSALSDGDVYKYKRAKHALDNAIQEFLNTKQKVDSKADKIWQYTLAEFKQPGFIDRYTQQHKERYPDYDAEFFKKYEGQSLRDFLAFRNIRDVYIATGDGSPATKAFIDYVSQSLASLYEPKNKEAFIQKNFTGSNLENLLKEFINAILLGELVEVRPYRPSKDQKVPGNWTTLKVKSKPFRINSLGITIQCVVILLDKRGDLTSPANVSLRKTESVQIIEETESESEEAETVKLPGLSHEEEAEKRRDELLEEMEAIPETKADSIASVLADIIKNADLVPYKVTNLSDVEFAEAMREGYRIAFGTDPSAEVLAGGWSQAVLESGRPIKLPNNNVGNIKALSSWINSGNSYFIKKTGEYTADGKYYVEDGTKWRAYNSPAEGAAGYWRLIGNRYKKAMDWMAAGDPKSASVVLGLKGYYTAPINGYSKYVSHLYKEFMNRISPKLSDLQSVPMPEPGQKPLVKKWRSEYSEDEKNEIIKDTTVSSSDSSEIKSSEVDDLISKLIASPLTNIVKKAVLEKKLPKSKSLVVLNSNNVNYVERLEFARAASSIMEQIDIDARICEKNDDIKIKCKGIGTEMILTGAVQAICDMVSYKMREKSKIMIWPTAIAGGETNFKEVKTEKLIKNCKLFNARRLTNAR